MAEPMSTQLWALRDAYLWWIPYNPEVYRRYTLYRRYLLILRLQEPYREGRGGPHWSTFNHR